MNLESLAAKPVEVRSSEGLGRILASAPLGQSKKRGLRLAELGSKRREQRDHLFVV